MTGELKVVTAHVRELAVKQGEIAAEIAPAQAATNGVTWNVTVSHGLICTSASVALAQANTARGLACAAMQKTSLGLGTHSVPLRCITTPPTPSHQVRWTRRCIHADRMGPSFMPRFLVAA